jgi:hypothetical protein
VFRFAEQGSEMHETLGICRHRLPGPGRRGVGLGGGTAFPWVGIFF